MDAHSIRESDASSDSSSASSSSSDTVLIAKPLNQKHRKKLQAQLQQDEHASPSLPLGGRSDSSSATVTTPVSAAAATGKSDLICLVCEQDGELLQCSGPCVSAFHLACLGLTAAPARGEAWKCPSCTSNTHVCFHCKRLGASVPVDASGAAAAASSSQSSDALRPVRKCRALSCGKFYHSDCIAKLPLARIAGANFICPLHTCAACEQSGAKKESVRCLRCPVAFHTSCLPQHCGRSVPGKRIICPKHAREDARAPNESAPDAPAPHSAAEASDRQSLDAEHALALSSSGASSSSGAKRLAKSLKREKKKKKKSKRKKEKKRRDRSSTAALDTEPTSGRDAAEAASLDRDSAAPRSNDREHSVRDSIELPALTIPCPEAVSPATSSSLFESPATSNERIKARLVEALGQSDDDVESSLGSPVALRTPASGATGDRADGQSPRASRDCVSGADDGGDRRKPMAAAPDATAGHSERPTVSAANDNDAGGVGRSPSDSASQSSGEKAARPARRESQSPVAAHAKDLTKAFTDALGAQERQSNSEEALDGLSVHIPHSPAAARRSLQALDAVSQPQPEHAAAEKERVSDGEDGDDEGPGGSSTPTLRRRVSSGGVATPRASDAGADDPKTKTSRASKPKKKKKRVKSAPDVSVDAYDGAGEDESGETVVREEAKWVQCDSCKKWRTVPKAVDLDAMPERWYCKMNTWDAAFASCGVAEEVVNGTEAKKPKHSSSSSSKRSKVRAKAPAKTPVAAAAAADAQTVASVSDGGASSPSSSGAGSYTSKTPVVTDVTLDEHGTGATATVSGGDSSSKSSKLAKKQEKHAKKRKLKLKLKEKYREVKWVQCESAACGKWRVVPSSIDVGQLPAVWTCQLNTWSPELAMCAAPNPPDVEAFLSKSHSKKTSSSAGGASRPSKKLKASSESAGVAASDASATTGATLSSGAGASGSDQHSPPPSAAAAPAKSTKPAKAPKGGVNPPGASTALHASASASSSSTDASVSSAPLSGSGGAGTAGQSGGSTGSTGLAGASASSSSAASKGRKVKPDGIKKTVLEWAQCEKCNKWRKLPQHIKSSTLPDKWYCTMNHWDPLRASCAMAEEVDQEPLSASPLPSSQNWYPMPGHVTGATGVRSKRSKLSYSELLYASTGQLRKTYTSESSTHTFELDGRVYHRDDQYKDSSMYVSPDALVRATKASKQPAPQTTSSSSDAKSAASGRDTVETDRAAIARLLAANPLSVEQVATLVLDAMDLRRSSTVAELYDAASSAPQSSSVPLSLALVAAAVHHLVQRGLLEALECGDTESDESTAHDNDNDSSSGARVGSKRRKSTDALFTTTASLSSSPARAPQYRKVPKRPLKASKCWKLGHSAFEFPLKE